MRMQTESDDAGAAVYKNSPDEAAMVVRDFLANQLALLSS